jgi:hypothetical protein
VPGQLLSEPEDGPPFVVSLTDTLIDALATASPDDFVRLAEPWSMTDALRQIGIRVEVTADVLAALAGLAQRAQLQWPVRDLLVAYVSFGRAG